MLGAINPGYIEYYPYPSESGGGARAWTARDLLIDPSRRYNTEGSFYDPARTGGLFGPVALPSVADPADSVPVYNGNNAPISTATTSPNALKTNNLTPFLVIGIVALLLLK